MYKDVHLWAKYEEKNNINFVKLYRMAIFYNRTFLSFKLVRKHRC